MSYTGTQVYFPATTSTDAVAAAIKKRFGRAKVTSTRDRLVIAFGGGKTIRLSRDGSRTVAEEARWLGAKATPPIREALGRATQRFEIVPDDPRADDDDMYNELLSTFELVRGLPDAVGHDPFNGELYHQPPKPAAKKAGRKTTAKTATKQASTARGRRALKE